jgi:uncharacterized membrane-anchored protein
MKQIHAPSVNARYWTAITLASVFGTNMGDYYAHERGLGILQGLGVLALLTAIVFVVERFDARRHEAYYWLVIILIRTGATNIADYLAYRAHIPELPLTLGLIALLALFGWGTHRSLRDGNDPAHTLPQTNAAYWLAMLSAGVFGTVAGDIAEHKIGEGVAAIVLTAILLAVLFAGRGRAAQIIALYWTTVAVARTAGTAIGDWLAENKIIHIGLPAATLLSGIAFVAVLVAWRSRSGAAPAIADAA